MKDLAHSHLENYSKRNSSRTAVCMNDIQMTYEEVYKGAFTISSFLNSIVDSDHQECVGLFMPKCPMTVMAIYGVLLSGSAYVPMDVENPEDKLNYIISDCEINVVITTSEFLGRVEDLSKGFKRTLKIVVLVQEPTENDIIQQNKECYYINPMTPKISAGDIKIKAKVAPEHLAAVLYTSGSSGVPKGVMITHSAITAFTKWAVSYFNLDFSDRFISHAPLHFDLSLFDLFAAHRAGGTTVLIPPGFSGNPKQVAREITKHNITIWQSVPSMLTLLAKYGDMKTKNSNIRHMLFAGEQMPVETLTRLSEVFINADFHNVYGATETNDTFIYSISKDIKEFPNPLPIGKPLPYVDYKIIGDDKYTCQQGELYVRTPTMMKGYRNRNDDSMRMLATKKNEMDKGKFYRTRDVVKMLPDGNLVFCGRNDDIVKTNGYRINLLEIERCLQSNDKLNQTAVFALPDSELGNKIIAVVVPILNSKVSVLSLKQYCAEKLPKYAIPHIFEIQSAGLPKTSSGKIDRKQLKNSYMRN